MTSTNQRSLVNTFVLVLLALALAVTAVIANPGAQEAWRNLTNPAWEGQIQGVTMVVIVPQGRAAYVPASGFVKVAFADITGFSSRPPKCPDGRESRWVGYTPSGTNGSQVTMYAECPGGGHMYQTANRSNGGPQAPAMP